MGATATVLDQGSPEALDGLRAFLARNPRTGVRRYGVRRDAARHPREADLAREVRWSVVVRVRAG